MKQLDREVFIQGVGKLRKDSPNELSGCCPACGDRKNRLHMLYIPRDDFTYMKCWNAGCELEEPCGVMKFVSLCVPERYEEYRRATFGEQIQDIKNKKSTKSMAEILKEMKTSKEPEAPKTNEPYVPLDLFTKVQDSAEALRYLKTRQITPGDWYFSKEKFAKFSTGSTAQEKNLFLENYLIIPIMAKRGSSSICKGFYSRSIEEKRFTTFLMDGQERMWEKNPGHCEYIFEGIFDALSTDFENSAAMIGADISKDYLKRHENAVFVFDNDKTGTQKAIKYSNLGFDVCVWPEMAQKDCNEMLVSGMTSNQITQIIKDNTKPPGIAEIHLRMKRF